MRGVALALVSLLLVTGLVSLAPTGLSEEEVAPEHADCGEGTATVHVDQVVIDASGEDVHACVVHQLVLENQFPSPEVEGRTLVVIAHGFGHTVQASWVPHMVRISEDLGEDVVLVATNYRDNFGFPIGQGAEDLVRATIMAESGYGPFERTILLSVSMGSAIGGTAIHIAPEHTQDGEGLYDAWLDVEGATSPHETWAEAKAISPAVELGKTASEGMERDAGGTPAEAPEAWARRIPVLHADDMKAAGLQQVNVIHGLNDGLVPYDQGRQMTEALVAAGIPVSMYTILRGAADHTSGTTPTSHAGQPQYDPNERFIHLAGHGSEADAEHIVMQTAFARLHDYVAFGWDEAPVPKREFVVDDGLGTYRVVG